MPHVIWVVIDDHGRQAAERAPADVFLQGLPPPDRVVCADSGVTLALALDLDIDLVVGDLDSVPADDLRSALDAGADVHRHPPEKDRTDLELALQVAAQDAERVVVVGGAGGRLDHALANVAALASDALADVEVIARLGTADVHVVRGAAELDLPEGATVTLLPSGGPANGVTTTGLRYPLQDDQLSAWSARGVSNVVEHTPVRLEVDSGCVLVVHPRLDQDS